MLNTDDIQELIQLTDKEIQVLRRVHNNTLSFSANAFLKQKDEDKILKYERLKIKLVDMYLDDQDIRPEVSE